MPVVDGEVGRAFDLRDRAVDAGDVAAAIRDGSGPIEIRCPEPGPVHERVGVIEAGRSHPLQAALAAAARSRGIGAPQDDALATVRRELRELDPPAVGLEAERKRLAETDDAADLEERVATLRGQLQLARDRGDDPEELETARERAVTDLAERRTERLAAEQRLERAREEARSARDRRERRLELEDRERNLQRAARRHLAAEMQPALKRALAALPADARTGETPGSVEGEDAVGAMAVCRVANLGAPVVLAYDAFAEPSGAAAALDAPVIVVAEP